ncbi:condensation protein, partial [Streptomyces sp. GC420]|nr:condensation protein [Streptomyces sp. GC420]
VPQTAPARSRPPPAGFLARPARIAGNARPGASGNGMLLTELPVPRRTPGAPYTVNDQLLVATALMIAAWNRLRHRAPAPMRITMPVDDRPRGTDMPIGNGTRLVEVPFGAEELTQDDPRSVQELLRRTADRTRALKAASRPQLGHGAALLTAPVLPVGVRAALTRALRRAAAPWTSTTLLSNIGRIPYPLDFGDAGRATAVWFSAPARMPRGLTVTTAGTGGRLHIALRWSRALLDDAAGARLCALFEEYLRATTPEEP